MHLLSKSPLYLFNVVDGNFCIFLNCVEVGLTFIIVFEISEGEALDGGWLICGLYVCEWLGFLFEAELV